MIKFYLSALNHQTLPGKRHVRSIKSRPSDFSMKDFFKKKKINEKYMYTCLAWLVTSFSYTPEHVNFQGRQGCRLIEVFNLVYLPDLI